ncbi:uncharacterized protein LOC132316622 [Cornus florida]|uniref:uncharacterized protein LOC132316622 n=1 Tax=Cornus florida TaxID=4283 RepID=UPI00289B294F|nr:uncharacterized protein LOC132316622 [Cornus florida]
MRIAQNRQKCYVDRRTCALELQVGDHVLLKVSHMKGVMRFGKKGKSSPHFVDHFMITDRIGTMAYCFALPDHLDRVYNVFHVSMLRKFLCDKIRYQHIDVGEIELQPDATYVEQPCRIIDCRDQIICNKVIPLIRVQWTYHNEAKSTWEQEDVIRSTFPDIMDEGKGEFREGNSFR